MSETPPRPGPFRGPQPFQTGDRLYGRDAEARALLSTLIAERIVLLHSPSGAGKTSLIQAALIPRLEARDFTVLPTVRVGQEPPPGWAGNRYLRAALLSLEEGRPPEEQQPLGELERLTLAGSLERRFPADGATDLVLIVDQFEEVLTRDPTDGPAKAEFFRELGEALRIPRLWALFVVREEYVAALEPYARLLPTRLATHFRLELLGVRGALEALRGPPAELGVTFPEEQAARLADDLRRVNVQQSDGGIAEQLGPTVEPVQLQVVGLRLWELLPAGATAIAAAELTALGNVGDALGDYYARQVAAVAGSSGVSERELRTWFERRLITPQGVRGEVLQGQDESGGLPNAAARRLVDAYLVRAETRRGATWFELAHDRLIAPVRASNAAWFAANLSTLQRQAELWGQQGRPPGLLLRGEALREAEGWVAANAAALTGDERDLLERSREGERQARRVRNLAIGASLLAVAASLAFVAALLLFQTAQRNARQAAARALAAAAVSNLDVDPQRSLILARAAVERAAPPVREARDALQLALQAARLQRIFSGHHAGVTGVAYSPDGASIATSSNDGTVRIWPAEGGEPQALELGGDLLDVAFAPGGALATSELREDASGAIRFWGADGDQLWEQPQVFAASRLAFSPDGATLALASGGGAVVLLAAADGSELGGLALPTPAGEESPVIADVAYSPDGVYLLAGDEDGGVTRWDAGGTPERLPSPHTGSVGAVAYSHDGRQFASADDLGVVVLWDAGSTEPVARLLNYATTVYAVAFSHDDQLLAVGRTDGVVQLWNLTEGTPLLSLHGHSNSVTGMAFSPDGRFLASGSLDRTARLWSLALLAPDGVSSAAWSPDGATLATGNTGVVRLWDAGRGTVTRELAPPEEVGRVVALAYSPAGDRLAVAIGAEVHVWDAGGAGEPLRLVGHEAETVAVAWSPDGARLASAGDDQALIVWDARDGAELYRADDYADWVTSVAWSADGGRIATCDRAGAVLVRGAADGAEHARFALPDQLDCNTVAWSPDGTRLLTSDPAGRVILWDAASGAELWRQSMPLEQTDARFSPDGARVYSAGLDRVLRVWDAATGESTEQIALLADALELRPRPSGRDLAVVGGDGNVVLLPLDQADLEAAAARRVVRRPSDGECEAYGLDEGCPHAQP